MVDQPGLLVLRAAEGEAVEIAYRRGGKPEVMTIGADLSVQR